MLTDYFHHKVKSESIQWIIATTSNTAISWLKIASHKVKKPTLKALIPQNSLTQFLSIQAKVGAYIINKTTRK